MLNSAADIGSHFLEIHTGNEDEQDTLQMKLLEGSENDYIGFITLKSVISTSVIAYYVYRSGKAQS